MYTKNPYFGSTSLHAKLLSYTEKSLIKLATAEENLIYVMLKLLASLGCVERQFLEFTQLNTQPVKSSNMKLSKRANIFDEDKHKNSSEYSESSRYAQKESRVELSYELGQGANRLWKLRRKLEATKKLRRSTKLTPNTANTLNKTEAGSDTFELWLRAQTYSE